MHSLFFVCLLINLVWYAHQIADATAGDIDGADCIIVGAPTWHTDVEDERSGITWDAWLYDNLPNQKVEGKTVAFFGCGDQQSYNEYFCDAAGELYNQFTKSGTKVYGLTSTEGFDHSNSKAEVDGKFIGCMFDEDNQYGLSEDRAKTRVTQLKEEEFY